MSLYHIDAAIMALVDPETGEIMNYEAFAALQMEREEKIENMALWYKNLTAEAEAIKAEEGNLAARRKDIEAKAEKLKQNLIEALGGDPFKTPRVVCKFNKSQKVQIQDEEAFIRTMQASQHWEYLTFKPPEVNRKAVTKAIKEGQTVEGAELVRTTSMTIK